MTYHEMFAVLLALTSFASYLNDRYLKLPKTIALTIISILIALSVSLASHSLPDLVHPIYTTVRSVDFKVTVLDVMLGYLLFASGLHVNSIELKREIIPVVYLASVGVVIATFLGGYMLYYVAGWFKAPFTLGECLIFGALIAPTDAIAVLGVFNSIKNAPQRLRVISTGEGLFNDAGAILILVILSQVVYEKLHLTVGHVAVSLLLEAGGGILWGVMVGLASSWLLKRTTSTEVATLITLAAASCGYVITNHLAVSGAIAMVVAGLIIGGYSKSAHFSEQTNLVINNFWELVDELLNGFLFVLIGLDMINIQLNHNAIIIGSITIVIVFISRLISILLPDLLLGTFFRKTFRFSARSSTLLAWGGIRGGLSIALALSIDNLPDELVAITYVVVLSSILIQGGTFKWAITKLAK